MVVETESWRPPLRVAALLLEDTELLGEPGWHHQSPSPPYNEQLNLKLEGVG